MEHVSRCPDRNGHRVEVFWDDARVGPAWGARVLDAEGNAVHQVAWTTGNGAALRAAHDWCDAHPPAPPAPPADQAEPDVEAPAEPAEEQP